MIEQKKKKSFSLELSDEDINDESDVKRHLLSIHNQALLSVLNNDLPLAVLDEKEKEYIEKNIQAAHEAEFRIADPVEAQYCKNRLLLKCYAKAILNRNHPNNHLAWNMLGVAGNEQSLPEPNIDEGLLKRLRKKEKGEKE